jgi:NTP pyrophosphatase (non-canonical NTP hydrolase)
MKLMVLDENDSWGLHKCKVYEGCLELVDAIKGEDKAHMAEKALDIIQVAIGILDRLNCEGIDMQQVLYRHNKKLVARGSDAKAVIKVQINER